MRHLYFIYLFFSAPNIGPAAAGPAPTALGYESHAVLCVYELCRVKSGTKATCMDMHACTCISIPQGIETEACKQTVRKAKVCSYKNLHKWANIAPIPDYKITVGHWPFSEQISKVATQNLDQLGLNCTDGRPKWCY